MPPTLRELYAELFNEAGPHGPLRRSDVETRFPDAFVMYDRDIGPLDDRDPHFSEPRPGRLVARLPGGRTWTWAPKRGSWVETHGDVTPKAPGRGRPDVSRETDHRTARENDLFDRFSMTEAEFRTSVSKAAEMSMGRGWAAMVDSAYGPGSTDRMLRDLWRNHWTDHEAVGEVLHYYDVAQQAAAVKRGTRRGEDPPGMSAYQLRHARDGVATYPMRIGPRYDMPRDRAGEQDLDPRGIRTTRPTDPGFFAGVTSFG